jgi:hypothetical protein
MRTSGRLSRQHPLVEWLAHAVFFEDSSGYHMRFFTGEAQRSSHSTSIVRHIGYSGPIQLTSVSAVSEDATKLERKSVNVVARAIEQWVLCGVSAD